MIQSGIYPFSSVDKVLSGMSEPERLCLLDTNVTAGWSYSDLHSLGEDCEFIVEKLGEYSVTSFASVTTKSEFYDFVRRVILSENLLSIGAAGSKWRISSSVRKRIENHKRLVDQRAAKDELPLLSDYQLKELKKDYFIPRNESGKDGWLKFCSEVLEDDLQKMWETLESSIGINYLDTQDTTLTEILPQRPQWEKASEFVVNSGISMSDAFILNIFQSSTIPILVSADFDVGYAFRASGLDTDKLLFLPDKLAKEVSRLRF